MPKKIQVNRHHQRRSKSFPIGDAKLLLRASLYSIPTKSTIQQIQIKSHSNDCEFDGLENTKWYVNDGDRQSSSKLRGEAHDSLGVCFRLNRMGRITKLS